jgi:hypothetical protein
MERFGQRGFMDELDGPKIHRLANIMTLDHFLRIHFDRLELWLEADDVSQDKTCGYTDDLKLLQNQNHTYRISSNDDLIIRDLPSTVTFISSDDKFDLPDPRYIKMHAACCRVAHMSGAAGYMDDIMDDLDQGRTQVLSEDGSGGILLDFALLASRV